MTGQSNNEQVVAQLIIDALFLEEITANEIIPEDPLFGDGLGLDSIDALEIAMAVSQKYGFKFRSDNPDIVQIFSSLRALTKHIQKNKQI